MYTPSRTKILASALENLEQAVAWRRMALNSDGSVTFLSRFCAALTLIELLEEHDCGSVGGFDKGQRHSHNAMDRWLWLAKKHNPAFRVTRPMLRLKRALSPR